MGNSGKQAHHFYADVIEHQKVWTINESGKAVVFSCSSGLLVQPFWSKLTRIEKIIKTVPDYSTFQAVEISWDAFKNKIAHKLENEDILVGVNWSGKKLTGYDMPAYELIEIVSLNQNLKNQNRKAQ